MIISAKVVDIETPNNMVEAVTCNKLVAEDGGDNIGRQRSRE